MLEVTAVQLISLRQIEAFNNQDLEQGSDRESEDGSGHPCKTECLVADGD